MINKRRYQNIFIESITKNQQDIGAVYPTREECEKYFDAIKSDILSQKKFYLAVDIHNFNFFFQHNLSSFLPVKDRIDMNDYLQLIHPDYAQEYMDWAACVYTYAYGLKSEIKILGQCYKIILPLRTREGYYWILQESYPLQLNSQHKMVSHLNEYTVIVPFDEKEKKQMLGSFWTNHFENKEWTQALQKLFFTREPFILTKKEKKILESVAQNQDKNANELAEKENMATETFQKHAKNIIKKAKAAFPNQFSPEKRTTLKEVILYIKDLDVSFDGTKTAQDVLFRAL